MYLCRTRSSCIVVLRFAPFEIHTATSCFRLCVSIVKYIVICMCLVTRGWSSILISGETLEPHVQPSKDSAYRLFPSKDRTEIKDEYDDRMHDHSRCWHLQRPRECSEGASAVQMMLASILFDH